jgi:hypothetical protein
MTRDYEQIPSHDPTFDASMHAQERPVAIALS